METAKKSIKVTATGKGYNHYEDYLIIKHKRELTRFLFERDLPASAKNKIWKLYSKRVSRENIIALYTHPALVFLMHLLDNNLQALQTNTSITSLN